MSCYILLEIWEGWGTKLEATRKNILQIFNSNPTGVSKTWGGVSGEEHSEVVMSISKKFNILMILQAPSAYNFLYSKLRPLNFISRLNPPPESGSNIIISQKKLREVQLRISSRYAFQVSLFLDLLLLTVPVIFTLPWPCSCGQLSPYILLYTYYMSTLELKSKHFLQEANCLLFLEKYSKLPSQVSRRIYVLARVEIKNSVER